MKRVCIVTGTRAEYGLLKPLIKRVDEDNELELQLIVTGTHLSPEFGFTCDEIIKDKFMINEKIEILLSSDTPIGISKSMGLAMISFSEMFERLKPDLVIILGDRYEMLAVASTALVANVPIAHLHGGEITEGLIDDAIRHSISKMSYLHFTSTEDYRRRVIQLGENPDRVFDVGALGVENINTIKLMDKQSLYKELGLSFDEKFALVTFHPVTLENNTSKEQFREVLDALIEFDWLKIIITKANSDVDGRIINKLIDEYVKKYPDRCKSFTSLGQLRYLSAMKYCEFVIGNSSSGIIEAPTLKKPTINIGDRQKGRMQSASVINCNPQKNEISNAIKRALSHSFLSSISNMTNPYGNGKTSEKILQVIKKYLENSDKNLKKSFFDLKGVNEY